MHARVKLLLMTLLVSLFVVPLAFAQDTTPSAVESFNQTATALAQNGASEAEATTAEPTTDLISQFAATATALAQPRTETTPAEAATVEASPQATAEATVEPAEEATAAETPEATVEAAPEVVPTTSGSTTPPAASEDAQARGLPLGILLIGAVAVLLIGTIVIIQENPRPLDDEE